MSSALEQHVADAIAGAALLDDPFPYFQTENVPTDRFTVSSRSPTGKSSATCCCTTST
jgi:hypothetical protein